MATEIRRRRGSTADHSTFTGAPAELTVDTDKNTIVVHDGATAGGWPVPTNIETLRDVTFTSAAEEDGLVRISGVWVNTSSVTGGLRVPSGTEAQRSVTGGFTIRFNTTAGAYEGYNGTSWVGLGAASAELVPYDNTSSGLTATDVQAAVDETVVIAEAAQTEAEVESAIATRNIATVRQTTERGPIDASGLPDLLEDAGGLQVQTKGISASTPLVVVLTLNDDEDYRVRLTSNLAAVTLADDTDDQQIVLDVTPEETPTLVVTPVWTFALVAPSSPSTGDVWYNTRHWGLPQEWDGSAWVDKYYSFPLGQASAAAGAVTDVVSYAYKGHAYFAPYSVSTNSIISKNHNIGTGLIGVDSFFRFAPTGDRYPLPLNGANLIASNVYGAASGSITPTGITIYTGDTGTFGISSSNTGISSTVSSTGGTYEHYFKRLF